jgi:hypothetical protein
MMNNNSMSAKLNEHILYYLDIGVYKNIVLEEFDTIKWIFNGDESQCNVQSFIVGLANYLKSDQSDKYKVIDHRVCRSDYSDKYEKTITMGLKLFQKFFYKSYEEGEIKLNEKQSIMLSHNIERLLINMILNNSNKIILNEVFSLACMILYDGFYLAQLRFKNSLNENIPLGILGKIENLLCSNFDYVKKRMIRKNYGYLKEYLFGSKNGGDSVLVGA